MGAVPQIRTGILVQRAGNVARSQHHRICITGLSGAGKTVLGTTVPNGVTVVTEAIALPTIRQWNPDQGVIEAPDLRSLWEAIRWAHDSQEARQFDTFVLDSATEAGHQLRRWITETSPDRTALENAGRKGTLSLGDYGKYFSELDKMMRALVSLPMHVVVLAQAFETTDEITKTIGIRPNFEGQKFIPRFPGYFELSGVLRCVPNLTGSGVTREVVFEGESGRFIVKGSKRLKPVEVPNISMWIEAMDNPNNP